MPVEFVVCTQRGDTGKGRIVDHKLSSGRFRWNVRSKGGNNAGHAVKVGDQTIILHLIPSGVLHSNVQLGLGQGMVIDPFALFQEVDELKTHGIELEDRLWVSLGAKLVMPWDITLDVAMDKARAAAQGREVKTGGGIGTTCRGIGPAYAHAASRDSLTVAHLLDPEILRQRLKVVVPIINRELKAFDCPETSVSEALNRCAPLRHRLCKIARPLHLGLANSLEKGEWVLAEGAQGRFLSVDCGVSYPYCTSSVTTANGVFSGLGLPLKKEWLGPIVGIVKAYQTAVGNHPMPTLIGGEREEGIRQRGKEFGATTGRPRHCCWINALELRNGVWANGCTEIVVTKLDVLDEEPDIPIACALELDGHTIMELPDTAVEYFRCKPVYNSHVSPGWLTSIQQARRIGDLPANARDYLAVLERIADVPITGVSVGPERDQFCT